MASKPGKKFILLTVMSEGDPFSNPQYGHFDDTLPSELQGKVKEEDYKHLVAQIDAVWYPIERDAGPSLLACCCCCLSCMTCGLFCVCFCCYLCASNHSSKNKKIEARREIKDILDAYNKTVQETGLKFTVSPVIGDMYVKIALRGDDDEDEDVGSSKPKKGQDEEAENEDEDENEGKGKEKEREKEKGEDDGGKQDKAKSDKPAPAGSALDGLD